MPSVSLLLLVGLLSLWIELTPISGWKMHERCHHPVDHGQCNDHKFYTLRFYYDHKYKTCKKFYYHGCKGNDNNFESFKECLHFCKEKPGVCPKASPDEISICPALCRSDWECDGKKKCCPYACKVECMDPV